MTPPGFYTANGNTSKCPAGSYRGDAEWVPADEATSCYSCGEGVFSTTTESIEVYDPVTEQMTNLDVMTGPTGCCKLDNLQLRLWECLSGLVVI